MELTLLVPNRNITRIYGFNPKASEWDAPRTIGTRFEERSDGWLIPTKLSVAGLAKHVELDQIIEDDIEGGPNDLKELI